MTDTSPAAVERPCPNCGVTLDGHSGIRSYGYYRTHDTAYCLRYLRDQRNAANVRADAAEAQLAHDPETIEYLRDQLAAAIAEAHDTGCERAAWKEIAEAAEAQLAVARDAALVEAARLADGYGPVACDTEMRDAILALRDKPAPGVTVQEAAKVLLDLLKTPSEKAPIEASHIEDVWTATFRKSGFAAVKGFLRAIAGGGDE